jgi:hypothetical protein
MTLTIDQRDRKYANEIRSRSLGELVRVVRTDSPRFVGLPGVDRLRPRSYPGTAKIILAIVVAPGNPPYVAWFMVRRNQEPGSPGANKPSRDGR